MFIGSNVFIVDCKNKEVRPDVIIGIGVGADGHLQYVFKDGHAYESVFVYPTLEAAENKKSDLFEKRDAMLAFSQKCTQELDEMRLNLLGEPEFKGL